MRQNPGTANAMATKMYEEKLKLPLQRDPLDDAAIKVGALLLVSLDMLDLTVSNCFATFLWQRYGESPLLDVNHASILRSAAATGQTSGCFSYRF